MTGPGGGTDPHGFVETLGAGIGHMAIYRHRRRLPWPACQPGLHGRPDSRWRGSIVTSYETQVGLLSWFGRLILGRHLRSANQEMLADLGRAASVAPL